MAKSKANIEFEAVRAARERSFKRTVALIGAVTSILAVMVAAVGLLKDSDGNTKGVNVKSGGSVTCAVAEAKDVNCPVTFSGPPPAAKVVEVGSAAWGIEINNFAPHTEVQLRLYGPDGQKMNLGDYGRRPVDAFGTASTKEGFAIWFHEPGEPTGTYEFVVSGRDASGRAVTVRAGTFEVSS